MAFGDSLFAIYSPGCVTVPAVQTALYGENAVKFFEGRLSLVNARNPPAKVDAIIAAYRVACADNNRSVIWISFSIPPELDSSTLYQMPQISFRTNDGFRAEFSLSREPGGSPYLGPTAQIIGNADEYPSAKDKPRTWIYILQEEANGWDQPAITPTIYNGSFKLQFYGSGVGPMPELAVPSTEELLSPNPFMPLNGRLSGNWVMDGAPDQGIMLAVSELVAGSMPSPDEIAESKLLMFLSWYTFDAQGNPLWLTGSAQFLPGESEVSLSLDLVSQGEFLGQTGGQRTQAGSLNLRAISCGQIDVDYDLSGIGLGSGETQLKRLFSLEISDYPCSDKTDQQGVDL